MNKRYKLLKDLPGEVWVPVYGWEKSHLVSSKGRIRSVERCFLKKNGQNTHYKPVILKQYKSKNGYFIVGLNFEKRKMTCRVNVLVAQSFIDPLYIEKGLVAHHKDGNKENNNLDNIKIATYSENLIHARETGLNKAFGSNHPASKLTFSQVCEIRTICPKGRDTILVAKNYGISETHVRDILKGKKRKTA